MSVLDYADDYARDYHPYKGGAWCYEDGLLYIALVRLHKATGESRWFDHLLRLTTAQIAADGTLAGYTRDEFNIDNILAGRCLFCLSDQTGDPRYMIAADTLAGQLAHHPRTKTGNYWHKAIYPEQVWLDGLYMGLPFQIEYGQRRRDFTLVKDALQQFERALALTRRPDGLYAHGYDDSRAMYWADPETGQNQALWGRSLGWLGMALVDACALIDGTADACIAQAASDLLTRLRPLARPDGLWLQVPDQPELSGNYEETSASAMFAYCYLRAMRLGLWGGDERVATKTLQTLQETMMYMDEGRVRLGQICLVAGLGGARSRRDGRASYYLSEEVGADDPKGVGPFLMAIAAQFET